MEKELDLTILKKYLTLGVPADVLANELEELAFDYALANLRLQRVEPDAGLHDHAEDFICYLRDLSGALKQCLGAVS